MLKINGNTSIGRLFIRYACGVYMKIPSLIGHSIGRQELERSYTIARLKGVRGAVEQPTDLRIFKVS